MVYILEKTSAYFHDEELRSVEGAFMLEIENWQTRSCTESEFDFKSSKSEGTWRSEGSKHKTINDGKWIARVIGTEMRWFVKIDTIEELMSFVEKHGKVVVHPKNISSGIATIEIYDTYRE